MRSGHRWARAQRYQERVVQVGEQVHLVLEELQAEEVAGAQRKPARAAQVVRKAGVEAAREYLAQMEQNVGVQQTEDAMVAGCYRTAAEQACCAYRGKSRARHRYSRPDPSLRSHPNHLRCQARFDRLP